jgi:hypothetical protein
VRTRAVAIGGAPDPFNPDHVRRNHNTVVPDTAAVISPVE